MSELPTQGGSSNGPDVQTGAHEAQNRVAPREASDYVRGLVRTVPDWPEPGVQFRDITPVFKSPKGLRTLIDVLVDRYFDAKLDYVAGLDARGFMIGPIVAYELNIGFVPVRKVGKLPWKTVRESYQLEYGTATVEIHEDACKPGDRVLLIDDLIATGGTMLAGKNLLERLGATVIEAAALIDLPDLGGSARLRAAGLPVFSICEFAGD